MDRSRFDGVTELSKGERALLSDDGDFVRPLLGLAR